jgi:putative helicase MOV10L1
VQVLRRFPSARLLLCAPQNYSADLICSALAAAGVERQRMLRLNDPRHPLPQVRAVQPPGRAATAAP